ncbi:hypothetical protein BSKO_03711 [Bryopsis sp. KO-2023]|nr:hypothetical protein BSKO_03711 [Bryopsis sp. KO-2023]
MGNQLATPQRLHPEQLAELPNVVYKDLLGGGRVLKTVLCVHDVGALVVKVYHMRGDRVDLKPYERQLTEIRDRLMSVPNSHLWPFQVFSQNESIGYLVRPHIYANLYDRLNIRPFLDDVEKRWVTFQLLHALKQCHGKNVCHGDVKCENVLVSSWNWVFLTDFASYKPTYLPADNPADFSYYFDIGSRRRCYVAPERFFEGTGKAPKGPLLPSMDVFSTGCAIAELFLDGKALFDLSQLLSYRKGDYSPESVLAGVEPDVRELVLKMIHLDPASRLTPEECLRQFTPSVFPHYFEGALHPFFRSILSKSPDARVAAVNSAFHDLKDKMMKSGASVTDRMSREVANQIQGKAEAVGVEVGDGAFSSMTRCQPGGPSAYVTACESGNLLEEVGALLSDTKNIHSQLSEIAGRDEDKNNQGDYEGFIFDETGERPSRGESSGSVRYGLSEVGEVVTEEVHEYQLCGCMALGAQFRESGGDFVEVSQSRGGIVIDDERHNCRQRADVRLPKEGGWQWLGDWEVDLKGRSCDADGWGYKGGRNSRAGGWEAECTSESVWRRRCWVRQRTRRRSLKHGKANAWPQSNPPDLPKEAEEAALCDGMIMILVLLCTLVRGAKLQESRRCAVSLLYQAAIRCDEDCRLQRVVPYLLSLVSDSSASIRALALHYLIKLLSSIHTIPPSDARMFQDYVLPSLSLLPSDPEELVRVEYAAGIPRVTAVAGRDLMREGSESRNTEAEVGVLWKWVEKIIHELGSGDKSSANTRRALLGRVDELADFFGRSCILELLMALFTFLNDADWRLWASFFSCVKHIVTKSGAHTAEALIPYLEQGLQHADPTVVSNALDLVCHVCTHTRMRKCVLLQMCQKVVGLLNSPHASVRARAIEFVAMAAKVLSPADAFARLIPILKGALPNDPLVLSSPLLILESLRVSPSSSPSLSDSTPSQSRQRAPTPLAAQPRIEDDVLDARAPVYSTNLDKRLLQCGLTRHKAALEGRKEDTKNSDEDVRSNAAMMTATLIAASDKHVGSTKLGSIRSAVHYNEVGQGGASPWVRNQMAEALSTPLNTTSSSMSLDPSAIWRPRGVLLAHLAEHRRAVNRLAVAGKERHNPFFVSASNDGTVKVWDLRHLERDVNFHSRLTYGAQKGKILAVTTCEDSKSVASASSNGSIHVWRVEYVQQTRRGGREEYSGITSRQQVSPTEGAILDVHQCGPLLLYVTQRGGVHAWDTRMKKDAWQLPLAPRLGLIEHMALDPSDGGNWLLTGSSRGYLALWDVRFRLQVNGWRHPLGQPIDALASATASANMLGVGDYSGVGPLVYVVSGGNEVGLWDVEEGRCRQVLRVIPREETDHGKMEPPAALTAPSTPRNPPQLSRMSSGDPLRMGFARELAVHELYMPQPRSEGLRAVLPLSYGGVLTGGSDACVRLWDGKEPKQSYLVCGPPVVDKLKVVEKASQPHYKYQYSHHTNYNIPIIDECCLPTHTAPVADPFQDIIRMDDLCHKDCITGVAMAEVMERMLLTCSRDGVVKAWK